ncbi:MAG TPA: histidine kinase [Trebonia sp.]
MKRLSGIASSAWPALVQVLTGPDPAPERRWRSAQERRSAFAALAAVSLALGFISATHVHQVAANGAEPPASAWQVMLALAAVLPLPLAAKYPMQAWRTGWLLLLLSPLLPAAWWGGWPWGPPQVLALLGAFCLAAVRQRRIALWWMWALTLIPWCGWLVKDVPDLNGPASATIVFTAAAIVVDSVGSQLRARRALAAETAHADAERARRAALEERTRIARELHDVVAHHLSLIAIKAESAPYRLGELVAPVNAEFSSLSEVAREALTEMRRLLGVLREDEPTTLAPQPQLTDLPTLVGTARQAGVDVELSVAAKLGSVPPGIGICAYRIVQESLSNASQHAPGAVVMVSVDQSARAVRLRVANGPSAAAIRSERARERRPGHGLIGMRERVELLGGSLSAGPTSAGGFTVSVVLPLGETA